MEGLTNKDRRLIAEHLDNYIAQAGYPLSEDALRRTMRWAEGYTFAEIAHEEVITTQGVSKSVRGVVKQVKEWLEGDA